MFTPGVRACTVCRQKVYYNTSTVKLKEIYCSVNFYHGIISLLTIFYGYFHIAIVIFTYFLPTLILLLFQVKVVLLALIVDSFFDISKF